MEKTDIRYRTYTEILKEELIPAMGCTEPISLAYAGARARQVLGRMPEQVKVQASGSIIKNVKSVIVPNTGELKGIPAAVIAGIVAGDAEKELEVIAQVDDPKRMAMKKAMAQIPVEVEFLDEGHVFDLMVTVRAGEDVAQVRIRDFHTNIVWIRRNKEILRNRLEEERESAKSHCANRELLDMEGIWDFITTVDIEDIREVLERQIRCNMAIAEEGLRGDYGANIGEILLKSRGVDVMNRAKAMAAAGSDARMNGCGLPVIINSGSGNQGITCSVPVVVVARDRGVSQEMLLRALALSNLVSIHEKTGIGTLSAYCGAVSAGAGAGAGIAYLCGGTYDDVTHAIVNCLAIVSGIICDGAKASCAAKIASSVDAAILGMQMYHHGQEFVGGDGIVVKGIENTIRNVGRLGREGMKETNREIIDMMVEK